MGKLYIFGNGFDRHFGLKTGTEDFLECLSKVKIYGKAESAVDTFVGYGVLWSDFEQSISYINLDAIEEDYLSVPDYLSDHEYDRDGCIWNMEQATDGIYNAIFSALGDMVANADNQLSEAKNDTDIVFDEDDLILTFNYTSTIEQLFDIPKSTSVLHIHGRASNGDSLILGYCEETQKYNLNKYSNYEDGDFYLESQIDLISKFYERLKKIIQMDKLEKFIEKAVSIDEVYVYGHSLGEVDYPYFEYIHDCLKPCKWHVSIHGDDLVVKENAKGLSFKEYISFFEW